MLTREVHLATAGCAQKNAYPSEKTARDVALQCWRDRGVDLRSYHCHSCKHWHLTKQDAEPMMRPGWREPAPSREERARERREQYPRRRGRR